MAPGTITPEKNIEWKEFVTLVKDNFFHFHSGEIHNTELVRFVSTESTINEYATWCSILSGLKEITNSTSTFSYEHFIELTAWFME